MLRTGIYLVSETLLEGRTLWSKHRRLNQRSEAPHWRICVVSSMLCPISPCKPYCRRYSLSSIWRTGSISFPGWEVIFSRFWSMDLRHECEAHHLIWGVECNNGSNKKEMIHPQPSGSQPVADSNIEEKKYSWGVCTTVWSRTHTPLNRDCCWVTRERKMSMNLWHYWPRFETI